MAELLRMPEVAAGAESALLSAWPISPGTEYAAGDVIAIIETDKAVVDYEAELPGTIVRPLVAEGAEVAIGDPIAVIAAPGEAIADVDATVAAILGNLPGVNDSVATAAETTVEGTEAAPVHASATTQSSGPRIFASPLARRLAREAGISLESIAGTGPQGRIRRVDIEAFLAQRPEPATSPSTPVGVAPPATDGTPVSIPHTRLRRAIAQRLAQSKTQAPHFYLRGSARVDRLLATRREINDGADLRVSVTDLLVKAMAASITAVPAVNVIWSEEEVWQYSTVDIGLAVATPTGLVTPVIRGAESLTVRAIARTTQDLAARAREGQLRQHELEGGVTSLTNLGMFGTEDFDAIINPPQSSILAVGAAREVPLVDDGAITVGTTMRFSLSVDHRPIDGATAAEWMAYFTHLLEHPAKMLA